MGRRLMIFLEKLKNASPTLLSFLAAGGVVATAVSAFKAAPELEKRKKEAKEEHMTNTEAALYLAPVYAPTAGFATGTVLCVLAANGMNRDRIVGLTGAYALLETSYREYRDKVRDIWDSDKFDADKTIMTKINEDHMKENPPEAQETENETPLWYDIYGDRYFHATHEQVKDAEYHLNRNFVLRGYVTLNEFYEFLGLEELDEVKHLGWGESVGFEFYGYQWIDFKHVLTTMDDGLECNIIYYPFEPTANYLD